LEKEGGRYIIFVTPDLISLHARKLGKIRKVVTGICVDKSKERLYVVL